MIAVGLHTVAALGISYTDNILYLYHCHSGNHSDRGCCPKLPRMENVPIFTRISKLQCSKIGYGQV